MSTAATDTVEVAIVSRWTRATIFSCCVAAGIAASRRISAAVEAAVRNKIDLSGANLTGANLLGANLSDANLTGANLLGANLSDANLTDADLSGANLTDANLMDANLSRAGLTGANLSRADLTGANLSGAKLSYAHLAGTNLSGAKLSYAHLAGTNLTDADLTGANLSCANLAYAAVGDQRLILGPTRSDGYMFVLSGVTGEWRVLAGCRNFTLAEACAHWSDAYAGSAQLRQETLAIIAHMLALAKIRGWDVTDQPITNTQHTHEEDA